MPSRKAIDPIVSTFFALRKSHALAVIVATFAAIFSFPDLWTGRLASDGTDTYFFSWLLSHHWRQWSGTGFTSYFETGILAPFPRSLLFSEFGMLPALWGWPLHALGANSFASYHWINFSGLFLTAVSMFAFANRIFRNVGIALWIALTFTFSGYQMIHVVGHLQMAAGFVFPMAFLCLLEFFETRRRRWLIGLTIVWISAFYFNVYYFAFLSYALFGWALYLFARSRPSTLKTLLALSTVGIVVLAAIGWVAFQYFKTKQLLPNIAFPPSSRQMYQLDYASILRSASGVWLGHDRDVSENAGYLGFGFLLMLVTYLGLRVTEALANLEKGLRPFLKFAFLLGLVLHILLVAGLSTAFGAGAVLTIGSVLYAVLFLSVGVFFLARPSSEKSRYHTRFFVGFAFFWFFVGMGTNFFGGHQPFNWFLEKAPLLSNLRAIGRLFVLVSFGLSFFSGYLLLRLGAYVNSKAQDANSVESTPRFDRRLKRFATAAFALVVLVGPLELVLATRQKVKDSLHDPSAYLAESQKPKLAKFYRDFSAEFPEASIYELPTREWGDQLRVYQFGATLRDPSGAEFRDTLRRFQGLTGFTPAFFTETIQTLNREDQRANREAHEANSDTKSVADKKTASIETLLLNLPVRFFVLHLDGPLKTSPRIVTLLKNTELFKLVRTTDDENGKHLIEVYERRANGAPNEHANGAPNRSTGGAPAERYDFGLVADPILLLALRDFLSVPANVLSATGEVEFDCPARCEFSMIWPYTRLAPQKDVLTIETGTPSLNSSSGSGAFKARLGPHVLSPLERTVEDVKRGRIRFHIPAEARPTEISEIQGDPRLYFEFSNLSEDGSDQAPRETVRIKAVYLQTASGDAKSH